MSQVFLVVETRFLVRKNQVMKYSSCSYS